ncbi:chloride channel protein [Crenobacter sp. SG2303]|uniref:Chloride channel protein n=1 Tax=Crenobacter oryzisoli TaxID=3056844 RepID=A0ABT7XTR7_9NEIS|nr:MULTISPECIES: chloride channel protein [unclassified Crenobacter]MDN0077194.1 chloride channel protein [Crenobacter sp. SG2303]MDN0083668.1 chloride channel protein [Crenobacter sp. SG2305]
MLRFPVSFIPSRRWRLRAALSDLLLAAVLGVAGALATILFRELLYLIESLLAAEPRNGLVSLARSLAPWQRVIVPLVGGFVAGLILQKGLALARGSATGDYMEAVRVGDGKLGVRTTLVKSGSSLLSIASGSSIGREGSMVALAALVGSLSGQLRSLPRYRRRLMVSCGAAAGLASAYHAPLAAVLFVAEIVWGRLHVRQLVPLVVSAVLASSTVYQLFGYEPVYRLATLPTLSLPQLPGYCLIALLLGAMAPAYIALLEHTRRLFGRLPLALPWRMTLGGLLVGLLSLVYPEVWGNGYSTVTRLLNEPLGWSLVLGILLAKLVATAASTGSGAVGGVFTPTLFVGAALGTLAGLAINALWPGWLSLAACTLVGMTALLAGATQAPLMAMLMLSEMTGQYSLLLPVMLAAVLAVMVSRLLGGGSIYPR